VNTFDFCRRVVVHCGGNDWYSGSPVPSFPAAFHHGVCAAGAIAAYSMMGGHNTGYGIHHTKPDMTRSTRCTIRTATACRYTRTTIPRDYKRYIHDADGILKLVVMPAPAPVITRILAGHLHTDYYTGYNCDVVVSRLVELQDVVLCQRAA
jgi:hypothetical protein